MFGFTQNEKLLKAMEEENVQKIIQAVINGADVNLQANGTTPLIAALSAERPATIDEVALLLSYGADVKLPNRNGSMPLHWADNAQIAEILLLNGAPVNHQNKQGDTALHRAHNYGVINKLLDFGANANIRNNDGLTPLQLNPPARVKIRLIHNGADVYVFDKKGYTPLMEAAAYGETDVINAILDRSENAVYVQNDKGETALMIAAENNQIEATKLLVLRKADLEVQDKEGRTAFMRAISCNAIETANFLLSEKANMNAQDKAGNTILLSLLHTCLSLQSDTPDTPLPLALRQSLDWLLNHHADLTIPNHADIRADALLQKMKEKQIYEAPQLAVQKIVSRQSPDKSIFLTAHERGDS